MTLIHRETNKTKYQSSIKEKQNGIYRKLVFCFVRLSMEEHHQEGLMIIKCLFLCILWNFVQLGSIFVTTVFPNLFIPSDQKLKTACANILCLRYSFHFVNQISKTCVTIHVVFKFLQLYVCHPFCISWFSFRFLVETHDLFFSSVWLLWIDDTTGSNLTSHNYLHITNKIRICLFHLTFTSSCFRHFQWNKQKKLNVLRVH